MRKACDVCGKEFEARKSDHKRCGPACTAVANRKCIADWVARERPPKVFPVTPCPVCDRWFVPKHSRQKRCGSLVCHSRRSRPAPAQCVICGDWFRPRTSLVVACGDRCRRLHILNRRKAPHIAAARREYEMRPDVAAKRRLPDYLSRQADCQSRRIYRRKHQAKLAAINAEKTELILLITKPKGTA